MKEQKQLEQDLEEKKLPEKLKAKAKLVNKKLLFLKSCRIYYDLNFSNQEYSSKYSWSISTS